MASTIPPDRLSTELLAAGRLIGLLTGTGSEPATVDPAWFEDPKAGLEGIRGRLGELSTMLAGVLGDPEPDPPKIGDVTGQWYRLPNLDLDVPTAAHIIAPAPGTTDGALGLGLYTASRLGPVTVEAHVYVPLADLQGRFLLVGPDAKPVHVGLSATSADRFAVENGASFKALEIDAQIHLDGTPPDGTATFDDLQGAQGRPSTCDRPADLADPTVLEWFAAVIAQGATPWLLQYPGDGPGRAGADQTVPPEAPDDAPWPMTVGDILVAAHLLALQPTTGDEPVYAFDPQNLQGSGAQIAEKLAFAVLDALASAEVPLVALPGGGLYVEHAGTSYGVRVTAQLTLGDEVDVCVGTWMTGEDVRANWMTKSAPPHTATDGGLSLLLLSTTNGTDVAFDPGFALTSVGVNLRGAAGAPLLDIDGYTLDAVELRAAASLEAKEWTWGAGVRLDGVGVPLAPGFKAAQGADGNAVARTLVAGDDAPSTPDGKQKAAVNPAFSAEVGYVAGGKVRFELLDPSGAKTDLVWFPVQRRFGPLTCRRVGVRVPGDTGEPLLGVAFDGGVALGPLDVELDDLEIDIDLKDPTRLEDYTLDLRGLAISFAAGGVDISGGLIKSAAGNGAPSYDGEVLIKAESLAIAAIGSFTALDHDTSLFVFAWLDAPLGGPPCFFVTGLSAGFGYNRALRIPAQGDIQSFPLVAGLSDRSKIGGPLPTGGGPTPPPSPGAALASLSERWVPVERGQYWLAAGVQFTTFEIIKTNALLVVEFGHDLVIAVLGISTLKQPAEGETYAYAELDLEVVFRPQQGTLQAAAVLAPGSFVVTPDAHLSGGFAFSAWWGAEHTGDFVFTIGGYHPAFAVPDWYPQEPRVGLDWKIGPGLELAGGAYLAITPSAMMCGTALAITFDEGPLRAWLKFAVDVMIRWKPFYLSASASISVGISFHLQLGLVDTTLSIELGARLDLHGPPIGFKLHVDWYIVSFTISHGPQEGGPEPMDWERFKALLPSKTQVAGAPTARVAAAAVGTAPQPQTAPAYLHIDAAGGLLRTTVVDGIDHWLVRAGQLALSVHSAIPATDVKLTKPSHPYDAAHSDGGPETVGTATQVAIRPMEVPGGASSSAMTMTVLALKADTPPAELQQSMATAEGCTTRPRGDDVPVANAAWDAAAMVQQVPKAVWGDPLDATSDPRPNEPGGPTVAAQVGAVLTPSPPPLGDATPPMVATVLGDRIVGTAGMSIRPDAAPPASTPPLTHGAFAALAGVETDARQSRDALFAALGRLGIDPVTNASLSAMATTPGLDFADEPMLAAT